MCLKLVDVLNKMFKMKIKYSKCQPVIPYWLILNWNETITITIAHTQLVISAV